MIIIYLLLFCSSLYSTPSPFNDVGRVGVNVAHDFAITNNNNGSRMSIGERGFTRNFSDNSDKLKPGMWGSSGYAVRTNGLASLTDEEISTPFFVELKEKSPEEKREMLILAKNYPYGDHNYGIRRRNMAALVKIAGIDPKIIQNEVKPDLLCQAVQNQDLVLVKLLLDAGADVHEPTMFTDKDTIIHRALSVPLAQLLEAYGAFKHKNASLLLHTAMDKRYDISLIPYYKEQYKKYNLSLLGINSFKRNILMECVHNISTYFAQGEVIQKVKALFQDLPDETVVALINCSNYGETVMQYIQKQSETAPTGTKNLLAALRTLLQCRLDTACKKESAKEEQEVVDCAICLDPLAQDIVGITKCCKQSLHGDCLQKWIALGNGCPLCRSAKPE